MFVQVFVANEDGSGLDFDENSFAMTGKATSDPAW